MDHEIKILQERYSQNIIEYNDSIQIDDYGEAMHQCTSCQKASKYSLIAYPNLDAEPISEMIYMENTRMMII